jgi:hypothetical protein
MAYRLIAGQLSTHLHASKQPVIEDECRQLAVDVEV